MTLAASAPPSAATTQTELSLTVVSTTSLCLDVRAIVLADPDGRHLPSFTAGSHIAVTWEDGRRNSYSLTGPAIDPEYYSISVRLDRDGEGGSQWMHGLRPGDTVEVSLPRSAFAPQLSASRHVLVAGGIGVTPILSHARAAARWGRPFEVIYSFHAGRGAHLEDLQNLCGDRLFTVSDRAELADVLDRRLSIQPVGAHLYTCGPVGMIDAVAEVAADNGWPDARVHSEPFATAVAGGEPFTAAIKTTGQEIEVGEQQTLLEALLGAGVRVPNLCRQGVCGECRTAVACGEVDHRDLYLTDEEKESGAAIMPCVSRAAGTRLELFL